MFSSCNPKFFAVRYIHCPMNPSCDPTCCSSAVYHGRAEAVLPPSDHYCIGIVAPSGDLYCIDIVVPSSDHCCTETVRPSSDHCGTTKVVPPSDHLHSKIINWREKNNSPTVGGGVTPWPPLATPLILVLYSGHQIIGT